MPALSLLFAGIHRRCDRGRPPGRTAVCNGRRPACWRVLDSGLSRCHVRAVCVCYVFVRYCVVLACSGGGVCRIVWCTSVVRLCTLHLVSRPVRAVGLLFSARAFDPATNARYNTLHSGFSPFVGVRSGNAWPKAACKSLLSPSVSPMGDGCFGVSGSCLLIAVIVCLLRRVARAL